MGHFKAIMSIHSRSNVAYTVMLCLFFDLYHPWFCWNSIPLGELSDICVPRVPPHPSLSPQYVLNVAHSPVQTRASVATASAWAAALNPTTTWRAPPASTTTMRAAACRTAPRAPTSSRAGAASPWTCALKCTYLATLSLSSTGENACPNAPPASHATRRISKDVPFTSESGWWC